MYLQPAESEILTCVGWWPLKLTEEVLPSGLIRTRRQICPNPPDEPKTSAPLLSEPKATNTQLAEKAAAEKVAAEKRVLQARAGLTKAHGADEAAQAKCCASDAKAATRVALAEAELEFKTAQKALAQAELPPPAS